MQDRTEVEVKMTIYALKSRFQGLLRPMVRRLAALGVTANQVTIAACLLSVLVGLFLSTADRAWFLILPIWMFVRMALNAVDGMLAREFGQSSHLGAYLNELTDVVSDAALYLPFAFIPPFDWRSVGAVIFIASLTEMTGVVGVMAGASRRYDGPMGKSDRAFVFALLAIWVATTTALPEWTSWIMWTIALAATSTIVNRIRSGLREAKNSKPAANKE
jgi:CDP-diacylglycerol--glycerol-3-phosphate 3-phosphatidyltransferase